MKKYFQIATNTLQEYFVYRINFLFWRIQVFATFVIFYTLWYTVSLNKSHLGIYSVPQLYSYFVIGYIIRALVFTTRTGDIGGEIQNGNISNLMLKPISVLKFYFSRDLIDKIFNIFFMFWEMLLIIFIFRPNLQMPTAINLLFFTVAILTSIGLFFLYSLIISFITFWADNAWSSRFLFGVVFTNLFSGQYIPLDFLPPTLLKVIDYTPFPYMFYYPVKIWLGQLSLYEITTRLAISFLMLIFIFFLAQYMWGRGKIKYQSYGN
jgi:ABC-2 type transport system permease protein